MPTIHVPARITKSRIDGSLVSCVCALFRFPARITKSRIGGLLMTFVCALLACQQVSDTTSPPPVKRHTYAPAAESRALRFPADHGPHRDAAYEWWYFTGHVMSDAAPATEQAGFEVTVFRISPPTGPLMEAPAASRPAQASFLSLHLAVTDLQGKTFRHQTLGLRERVDVARVGSSAARPLDIVVPGATIQLDPAGRSFRIDAELRDDNQQPLQVHAMLTADKPVTLHGVGGYSRKGSCPSCASHYASFPRLRGTTTVRSAGGERTGPTQVWFDHEFGSDSLGGELAGWDWLALQLDDGWELMAAQTRDHNGRPVRVSGTLISPRGEVTALSEKELALSPSGQWISPHSTAAYPVRWRVQVSSPVHPLDAELVPKLADQEISGAATALATYWEGTCDVRIAQKSAGTSYVEMTGYDPHRRPHL